MNFWSGLNDLKDFSSDSDKDTQVNDIKKLKSNPIKDELKIKFENLKQKNVRIKERYTKRKEKRKLKKDIIKQQLTNDLTTQIVDSNVCVDLPKTSEKNDKIIEKLEIKIDQAINESNIELAEKISDTLFEEQTKAKIKKQNDILKYESDVLHNRRKLDLQKTKYKWKFDAKQRWETKSNM
jgi:hypothetical protein